MFQTKYDDYSLRAVYKILLLLAYNIGMYNTFISMHLFSIMKC